MNGKLNWISLLLTTTIILGTLYSCKAQPLSKKIKFTRQDTLRGTITPERAWWDATAYVLEVEPNLITKTIEGSNHLSFKALKDGNLMQIDLQQPMNISSVEYLGKTLDIKREGNVYYLQFPTLIKKDTRGVVKIDFDGQPRQAVNPPWDGGWIWSKDSLGNPWVSVACQGLGASVWYPCKDHQSDEPDSASLTIIVPDTLVAVGNGLLATKVSKGRNRSAWTWVVSNPINSYNIIPYIGKYASFTNNYQGENGNLNTSFWVLGYNLEKAKKHFQEVPKMLTCFENWFGPYPFYEDGYKLVESPHLGMEHQSAVAYGNKYMQGYLGKDLSGTGWGLKWDYITIHESGHEWFANNVTTNDIADMWVHEGFTTYSEVIYTECNSGKEAGNEYLQGLRRGISNTKPVIGIYGVNQEGSGDMYPKGANLIHNIRQVINDDDKFRQILRGLNKEFYHQTINSADVERYISEKSGVDLTNVFEQYLRNTGIPVLEYKVSDKGMEYRWANTIDKFDMPITITAGKTLRINPKTSWQILKSGEGINFTTVTADPNYYITTKKVN